MAEIHASTPSTTGEVLDLALEALPAMLAPSGLCCWEVVDGDSTPRGQSIRYTLIVLLGLLTARAAGSETSLDVDRLLQAADARMNEPEVTTGDLGLRLWLSSRMAGEGNEQVSHALERALEREHELARLEGLELAWVVLGLACATPRQGPLSPMLEKAIDQLLIGNLAPSGLFFHFGAPGSRRRFPNFATEIYSILALASVAKLQLDDRAAPAACRAADLLLDLQHEDGGWPWLFDAERGTVVERYEVYSVHQHGMAPMALDALTDLTGDRRYAAAADAGIEWLFGANELGEHMLLLDRGFSFRSIRRRRPLDRLWLYSNTAVSWAGGRPLAQESRQRVEVNRTCRPYELGWLLEAQYGRRLPTRLRPQAPMAPKQS